MDHDPRRSSGERLRQLEAERQRLEQQSMSSGGLLIFSAIAFVLAMIGREPIGSTLILVCLIGAGIWYFGLKPQRRSVYERYSDALKAYGIASSGQAATEHTDECR